MAVVDLGELAWEYPTDRFGWALAYVGRPALPPIAPEALPADARTPLAAWEAARAAVAEAQARGEYDRVDALGADQQAALTALQAALGTTATTPEGHVLLGIFAQGPAVDAWLVATEAADACLEESFARGGSGEGCPDSVSLDYSAAIAEWRLVGADAPPALLAWSRIAEGLLRYEQGEDPVVAYTEAYGVVDAPAPLHAAAAYHLGASLPDADAHGLAYLDEAASDPALRDAARLEKMGRLARAAEPQPLLAAAREALASDASDVRDEGVRHASAAIAFLGPDGPAAVTSFGDDPHHAQILAGAAAIHAGWGNLTWARGLADAARALPASERSASYLASVDANLGSPKEDTPRTWLLRVVEQCMDQTPAAGASATFDLELVAKATPRGKVTRPIGDLSTLPACLAAPPPMEAPFRGKVRAHMTVGYKS